VAIRLILDKHIGGPPVMDQAGQLAGVLTEGDLLRRSETRHERHRSRWLEVRWAPDGSRASTPLDEVVRLVGRHRIKRMPVLDGDPLVGIVSQADLLRTRAHTLDEETAPTRQ
jgi:CBS domain-containing protein